MNLVCLKSAVKPLVFAASVLIVSLNPAHACERGGLPAAANQVVPTKNVDQRIFNAAILSEVNYERCRAGVSPLRLAGGLVSVAGTHANWMANQRVLSHNSTVRGQSSVQERVLASGLNVRRGSENIGFLPRYQFNSSKRIYIQNKRQCKFTTTSGKRIAPHSYATLASTIVSMWMGSKGHRRNVLDGNATSVGSALWYDASGSSCGQFYLSQNFAG